jgi:hypothetical protein
MLKKRNVRKRTFSPLKEEIKEEVKEIDPDHFQSTKKLHTTSSSKTIFQKQNSKNVILKMNEMMNDYPEKYYKQHLKSDWVKFFVNLIVALLHIIIFLSYFNSVNACSKSLTLNECIEKLDINYYYIVILQCFISAFLIAIILVLIITKIASIYQSPIIVIELIIFICINHKNDIYKNGLFSFKVLCYFIGVCFFFLLFFILFLIKLSKKHYFYSVFFFLLLFHCNNLLIYLFD